VRPPLTKEFFEKLAEEPPVPVAAYRPPLATNFRVRERIKTAQAQFSSQVPMPSVPEIPNILVGMVSDTLGMIVEGAIIEIRDSQGNPVRALRTNKLGQFRIVNPLTNDTYEVEIEKDGYHFDTLKVELKGEIMSPLDIRAKEGSENSEHSEYSENQSFVVSES
ncbi:MAG: carboxypeptidase-like regulatory domain-containing protein, partial [bacterium]|nr:carboxypeptidase-like regulatory domain-containing protein [bacterium]